ncbi:hypothetical protein [Chroococcidiopsis sp.]|uniref:hypothetical protein n=1 Tax=Chroococcidiopsis sp. TaxID=3088168 RepID=UPI003F2D611D
MDETIGYIQREMRNRGYEVPGDEIGNWLKHFGVYAVDDVDSDFLLIVESLSQGWKVASSGSSASQKDAQINGESDVMTVEKLDEVSKAVIAEDSELSQTIEGLVNSISAFQVDALIKDIDQIAASAPRKFNPVAMPNTSIGFQLPEQHNPVVWGFVCVISFFVLSAISNGIQRHDYETHIKQLQNSQVVPTPNPPQFDTIESR